jgi:hypothetical protein
MKIYRVILLSISVVVLWCGMDGGFAEGINQQMPGLDAKSGAKVARFKANIESIGSVGPATGAARAADCGSVGIGNVRTGNGMAPREVTTIVTGDVINVVGSGGCRQ